MTGKNRQTSSSLKLSPAVRLALLALLAVAVWWLVDGKESGLTTEVSNTINPTPLQVQSMKEIGEWEFLSISDEELVDTTRRGLFSDDKLVRIYYGTMRLGVNMHHVKPGWAKATGDTVVVTLPPVGLLDRDFIDEARTKSFYETGRWTAADREALYNKAYRMMMAHGVTPANVQGARANATAQVGRMLRAMGYRHVTVRFEDDAPLPPTGSTDN